MAYKPNMEDIKKLRTMTGAGLADVKKALTEAEGNFDKAMEIIREKGQAIAAKRSDRETANGCVLVKAANGFAAIIALKCETDFVANGADYIKLTQDILDAAVAAKAKSLDEVKELTIADGTKVQDAVVARSGITGEKMELDGYNFIEGDNVSCYDHMNKHNLCTMVQTNKPAEEQAHAIAMQVAAMNPVALDEASVPQDVKDTELKVAIEKTKEEQIQKAVEGALKKAGYNLYIAENEEHIAEGIAKGNITVRGTGRGYPQNQEGGSREEGCQHARADDSEHRQGPHGQVLQGVVPAQPGVHPGQQADRERIPQGCRQGSHCYRLQAFHTARRVRHCHTRQVSQ